MQRATRHTHLSRFPGMERHVWVMDWPPYLPTINPTEHLYCGLDMSVRHQCTLSGLFAGISAE